MRFLSYTLGIMGVLALTTSCSKEESLPNCQRYGHALVQSVTSTTDTVVAREDLVFNVNLFLENNCGSIQKTETTKNDKEWTVLYTSFYDGCECGEVANIIEKKYIFRTEKSGTYTLRFRNPSGSEDIVKTIVVLP